jgi:hypothetical protein
MSGDTWLDKDGINKPIYPPPSQGEAATIQLDFTNISAHVGGLTANGLYEFGCTADCYFKTGVDGVAASGTTSATAGCKLLFAGEKRLVRMGDGTYVAAIRAGGVDGQLTCDPVLG